MYANLKVRANFVVWINYKTGNEEKKIKLKLKNV